MGASTESLSPLSSPGDDPGFVNCTVTRLVGLTLTGERGMACHFQSCPQPFLSLKRLALPPVWGIWGRDLPLTRCKYGFIFVLDYLGHSFFLSSYQCDQCRIQPFSVFCPWSDFLYDAEPLDQISNMYWDIKRRQQSTLLMTRHC